MNPWFSRVVDGSLAKESSPSYYGDTRIKELSDDVGRLQRQLEGCDFVEMSVDDSETWDEITSGELEGFSISGEVDRIALSEAQRVERAIRGAIRAGYDGVDINRTSDPLNIGIESIEPWNRPEPDGDNGRWSERYTWDWFSEDELTQILADPEGYIEDILEGRE